MANTFTQIHLHIIFAVKYRENVILASWKNSLYKYIATTIQNNGHKMLAIGGVEDHIHILIGLRPNESLSHLVQEIKRDSSKWINNNKLCKGHFEWQEGFGAFSYAKSQIPAVATYIENQEKHHHGKSFLEEYKHILDLFGIEYDEKYLFRSLL